MPTKYIKGYDGLRAISILFVLQAHLGTYFLLPDNSFFRNRAWYLISGTTGVSIFFVLSGFLITHILLKEKKARGTISLWNFYIRRLLRLSPPLIILLATLLVLMLLGLIKQSYTGLVMALTYTFNFAPMHDMTPELGHMWSLSVEEQYYFLWPLAILAFKNYKRLLLVSFTLTVICILYMQHIGSIPFINTHSVSLGEYNIVIGNFFNTSHWFIPAIAPILAGSSISMLVHYKQEYLKQLFTSNNIIFAFSLLVFIAPLFLPLSIKNTFTIIQSLGVATFLTWMFFNQSSNLHKILEQPILRYIGRISYGLYVYHGIFIRTGPFGTTAPFQQFPLNILLTVIVAIISYEVIERNVLKYKQHFK